MEDFLRMNLGAIMGLFSWLIFLIVIYLIAIKKTPKYMIAGMRRTLMFFASIGILIFCLVMANQSSINNIPRKEIDRSYTKESQQKYEDRVNSENK